MNTLDAARRYIDKVPPETKGNRNDKLNQLAYGCLERFDLQKSDYEDLLTEWAAACSPSIPDTEAVKTIASAWNAAQGKGAVGSKARQRSPHSQSSPKRLPEPKGGAKAVRYELQDGELPEPVPDGARALLRAAFAAGESVRIVKAVMGDDGEIPDGSGTCITREAWLEKLEKHKGNPNCIFSSNKKTGIYIAINPLRGGGMKDDDVTSYRHVLVEFDDTLSPGEQFSLYTESKLPCAAVIFSGGKSVHAWVKVEARDRREYAERVAAIYGHFEASGYKLDTKNKNPSRLSRLPNCVRFDRHQELLALNVGCESFTEWLTSLEADSMAEIISHDDLENFDFENDPDNLIGNGWLSRGGSCLLIGPSGVGKSSLSMQFAIAFALGISIFGITPKQPLKTLIIQSENNKRNLARMFQGIRAGFSIDEFSSEEKCKLLRQNLIFATDTTHTGQAFITSSLRLIEKYRPDVVMPDPLISFIGDDISRQVVCSKFLREGLNPISKSTGVCWFFVHHTGKPSNDPKSRKHWQSSDQSYAGIGSSELTNWARSTMTLEQAGDGAFRLILGKGRTDAGATHPDETPTQTIWLKHSQGSIFWQQSDPPAEPEPTERKQKGGKPSKVQEIAGMNLHSFCRGCTEAGEGLNEIAERLEKWLAQNDRDDSITTCKRTIPALVANRKLKKCEDGKYRKGEDA